MRVIGIENGLVYSPAILRWLMASCVVVCLWLPVHAFAAGTINIYSHRQRILIQPFFDVFTKTTGIETKIVYASNGLAKRLQAEGAASPADVTLTGDITRLSEYPVNLAVIPTSELFSWGPFKRHKMPIERLAELAPQAQLIIDCVRW